MACMVRRLRITVSVNGFGSICECASFKFYAKFVLFLSVLNYFSVFVIGNLEN